MENLENKFANLHIKESPKLFKNFSKCVKGYHLINDDPIKEAPWESLNSLILKESGFSVNYESNGSHKPGSDLECSLGKFSNKSCTIEKGILNISSYRLTEVCSDLNHGSASGIINEIKKRNNFDYYSIICREETGNVLVYDWFLIPSDNPLFDPCNYTWKHKLSKRNTERYKKGDVNGWETDQVNGVSMSITFSMSSQLWIKIPYTEIKNFSVGNCTIKEKKKLNFIKLYDLRESFVD